MGIMNLNLYFNDNTAIIQMIAVSIVLARGTQETVLLYEPLFPLFKLAIIRVTLVTATSY